jgi:NAD/NADP transhydrogenase beta subunit
MSTTPTTPKALRSINGLAKLMDARFRVPGTSFRFGLDGIIGLIPGAGDLSTFAVSGYLLWVMAQNGASGFVLARMVLNVVIDAVIGAIPFVGDLFDIAFKANMRNMKLMQEHYQEGRHRGSAAKVIVPVLLVLLVFILLLVWVSYKLLRYAYDWIVSL